MKVHQLSCQVKAQYSTALGKLEFVEYCWDEPVNTKGKSDYHILQLCMLPIPITSKACFEDRWGPSRFENFGQLSLLPANELVRCSSDQLQQKSIFCSFDHAVVESYMERRVDWSHCPFERLLDIGNIKIRNMLLGISEELGAPDFSSEVMLELITGQLVIELSRHIEGLQEERKHGGLSARNLRLVEQRVSEHTTPPSVHELAELCGLSTRHLSRAFRESKGLSLGEYISDWRMRHAKRLMASGLSIKTVAYSVGFSAPSNFSSAFRRETGKTPTQYLRQIGSATTGC